MCTICLDMLLGLHTFKWSVGWSIYRPQLQNSHWRKAAVLCGTPDSPVVHRTAHCSLFSAPSHCPVRAGDRWRCRLFHTGQSGAHTGQSGGLLFGCHLELVVGLQFLGAPDSPRVWASDSPVCHRTVRCASRRQSAAAHLDFSWIFLMSSFEVLLSSIP
jgi:hypothetical protein